MSSERERPIEEGLIIVIRDGFNRAGFFVDNLIGQQQVVIKSLGAAFEGLMGVSGGAILADGKVGLILDAHGLFEYYSSYYGSDAFPAASASFPRI